MEVEKDKQKEKYCYYGIYSLSMCGIFCIILFIFMKNGKSFIHKGDGMQLENNDMKACNSAAGENVVPTTVLRSKVDSGNMTSVLAKASWNVIRLKKQK